MLYADWLYWDFQVVFVEKDTWILYILGSCMSEDVMLLFYFKDSLAGISEKEVTLEEGGPLIQFDWCPCESTPCGGTDTHRVRTPCGHEQRGTMLPTRQGERLDTGLQTRNFRHGT